MRRRSWRLGPSTSITTRPWLWRSRGETGAVRAGAFDPHPRRSARTSRATNTTRGEPAGVGTNDSTPNTPPLRVDRRCNMNVRDIDEARLGPGKSKALTVEEVTAPPTRRHVERDHVGIAAGHRARRTSSPEGFVLERRRPVVVRMVMSQPPRRCATWRLIRPKPTMPCSRATPVCTRHAPPLREPLRVRATVTCVPLRTVASYAVNGADSMLLFERSTSALAGV